MNKMKWNKIRKMRGVPWRQRENEVTLPHSSQPKHALWGGIKMPKQIAPRHKIAL